MMNGRPSATCDKLIKATTYVCALTLGLDFEPQHSKLTNCTTYDIHNDGLFESLCVSFILHSSNTAGRLGM